jgi:hypothetical protein
MTVFEAYGKLWDFFKESDSFVLEEDFRKISLITETPARDKAAVQSALDDWVESKMLHRQVQESWNKELKDRETKVIYILKKPLDSNEQSVSIGSSLAGYMSKEINEFCELIEDKTDWSDPSEINPKDVLNVLHILNFYKEKYKLEVGLSDDDKKK